MGPSAPTTGDFAPGCELQFDLDEVEQSSSNSASSNNLRDSTNSCEMVHVSQRLRQGHHHHHHHAALMQQLNNTGYNREATTTRQSFEILNEDSAEALEFFAAAANSGIEFLDGGMGGAGQGARGRHEAGAASRMLQGDHGSSQGGLHTSRQRHFSLEDYNEMNCSGNEDSSNESFATARTSGGHRHHRQSDGGQHSTKQPDTSGLMNTQHHGQFSMHVDDHVSYDGSDLAGSPPSTPSTGGLGAPPNAFMFPVNPSNSSNQLLESKFGGGGGVGRGREVDQQVTLENHGLLGELKRCIEESCQGQNTLQFPPSLLQEIASHVIQEASLEPCGLKGCLIFIYFEGENDCQYLNTLRCDPATIPTFELTLTLRQNQAKSRASWIPDIVKRNFSGMPNVMVSTSYRLVKRRKYRLNEIEELSLQ